MNRTRIITTAGQVIVKGDLDSVVGRLRGSGFHWLEFTEMVAMNRMTGEWKMRKVCINREMVVTVVEMD